jgi:hypothetical protein
MHAGQCEESSQHAGQWEEKWTNAAAIPLCRETTTREAAMTRRTETWRRSRSTAGVRVDTTNNNTD